MAEEAVVRIILEGDGGEAGGTPSVENSSHSGSTTSSPSPSIPSVTPPPPQHQKIAPPLPPSTVPPFDPVEAAKKRIEREDKRVATQEEYNKLKPPAPPEPEPAFDPVAVAKKRIEREERRAAADAEYAKLKPTIPDLQPTFDPLEIAKKRLERERQRAEVEEEYNKLNPPAPPPSAHELALKRLEAEKKRQEVEEEYAKLNPKDPRMALTAMEAAKKRRENERRAVEVDEAYKKEYGGPSERGSLDLIFARISTLRGTLGGLLGTTVGATLDVYHILRREQAEQEKKNKRKQLLKEADEAEADKYALAADKYEDDPSNATKAGGISDLFKFTKAGLGFGNKPNKNTQPSLPGASDLIGKGADTDKLARTSDPYAEVGGLIAKFGGFIPVIGTAVVAIGASVSIISSLLSSIDKMADNYGQYNPAIAQVQGINDMKKILNDMRRAQESGPELVEYLKAQFDAQQKLEDVKMKIYMKIVPLLTSMYNAMGFMLGIMENNSLDQIEDPTEIILNMADKARLGSTSELNPKRDIIGI